MFHVNHVRPSSCLLQGQTNWFPDCGMRLDKLGIAQPMYSVHEHRGCLTIHSAFWRILAIPKGQSTSGFWSKSRFGTNPIWITPRSGLSTHRFLQLKPQLRLWRCRTDGLPSSKREDLSNQQPDFFWTGNYVTMWPCERHVVNKSLSICVAELFLLLAPEKMTVFISWCKQVWCHCFLHPQENIENFGNPRDVLVSWSSHPGKWTFHHPKRNFVLQKVGVWSSKWLCEKGEMWQLMCLKLLCSCRMSTSSVRTWKCSETTRYHALQYHCVSQTLQ